ncbi:MAG: hypothetical protein U0800_06015 [Isosphaeraceae bacterium]
MNPPEHAADPGLTGLPETPTSPANPASPVAAEIAPRSSPRAVMLAAGAGLLAGLASWLVGEFTVTAFRPPLRPVTAMGVTMMLPTLEDEMASDTRNAALAYGVLGGFVASAMGLAGGWLGGSTVRGLRASGIGAMLGTAAGAIASFLMVGLYFARHDTGEGDQNLLLPLVCHGGIWGTIGAVGGLSFGLGLGGRGKAAQAMLGGFLGGCAGAGLYEVAGAALLPFARTVQPIATSPFARLLAHLAVAILVGLLAASAVGERRRGVKQPAIARA